MQTERSRTSPTPNVLPPGLFRIKNARAVYVNSVIFVESVEQELAPEMHSISLPQETVKAMRLKDLPLVVTGGIPYIEDETGETIVEYHRRIELTKQRIENAISRAKANKQQVMVVPVTDEWNMQFYLTKRGRLGGVWFCVPGTKEMELYEAELDKQEVLKSMLEYEFSNKADEVVASGVNADYRFSGQGIGFRSYPYGVTIQKSDVEQLIQQCPGYEVVSPEDVETLSERYSIGKDTDKDREKSQQIFLRPVRQSVEDEQPQNPMTDYVLQVQLYSSEIQTSLHLSHDQIEKNRAAFIEKETAVMKEYIDRSKDAARKKPGSSEDISPAHIVYARINHLGQRRRNGIDWVQSVYKDLMPVAQNLALMGAPLEVWDGIESFLDARDGKNGQPNYVYAPFGVMSMRTRENWSVSFLDNSETGNVEVKLLYSTQRA